MFINYNNNPLDAKQYDTQRLRDEFLTEELFTDGGVNVVYSHIDRIVIMGVAPFAGEPLKLDDYIDNKAFGTDFFLQRREMGILNLGPNKTQVKTKAGSYTVDCLEVLYLGQGEEAIEFIADGATHLYCLSAPAHHKYPSKLVTNEMANHIDLGDQSNANARQLNQYLHPDVLPTCQLCMGITHLKPGSVWNTMPAHTHERRMEAYLYFNIKPQQVVFHFMGEPQETRHIIVRDQQLVLSPSWSIHSGCGTENYSFVWGMLGENQTFDDMDFVDMDTIR